MPVPQAASLTPSLLQQSEYQPNGSFPRDCPTGMQCAPFKYQSTHHTGQFPDL